MKKKNVVFALFLFGLFVLSGSNVSANSEENFDKTLSPYFFVKSDDPEIDRLPLKSTSADVNISGVIADVVVTQVYKNEGNRPLEAIYIFPASTKAAVYGMKMSVGDRTIVAEIRERESARREYLQAKQDGKSASLLEQQRPNVFQMNVANILPNDVIKVELKYTEILVPTDAVYEFVYPTVVGPRYTEMSAVGARPSDNWTKNPYLHQGDEPTYSFDIKVNLAAGVPIRDIGCASHKVNVNYEGSSTASIMLDKNEGSGGNRDYIVKYTLAGGKIETGLLLFEGKTENFFLLMFQPPKKIKKRQVPPREYIFIVDVSGSMRGFPLSISKSLLKDLISNLNSMDKFNVLLFAGGSSVMSEKSVQATHENMGKAINFINRQRGGGGTRLLPALKRALSLPKAEGLSRSVVVVTDGYVAVETEAFDFIRNNLGNANMFTFGIGSSVNRYLIEGMARVGMGEPFVVTKPDKAGFEAHKFRRLIESPVLTDIEIDFGKFKTYDMEPSSIPDLFAQRPVIVFGKWSGKRKGTIQLKGTSGDWKFSDKISVKNVKPLKTNQALRYLWARHRIAILSDYNRLEKRDNRVREVTKLGLEYNLLTAHTSFIAVDNRVRLEDGKPVTVKQPLPLPEGVSDSAVGRGHAFSKGKLLQPQAVSPSVKMGERCFDKKVAKIDSGLAQEGNNLEKSEESMGNSAKLGEITITGDFKNDEVRIVFDNCLKKINECWIAECKQRLRNRTKVGFKLIIDQQGNVIEVRVDEGVNIEKKLEECIIQKLGLLKFSQSIDGVKRTIQVKFVFK
ncbi:VIT domain-containing protein [Thermodesulfobacteriota bacterium]